MYVTHIYNQRKNLWYNEKLDLSRGLLMLINVLIKEVVIKNVLMGGVAGEGRRPISKGTLDQPGTIAINLCCNKAKCVCVCGVYVIFKNSVVLN